MLKAEKWAGAKADMLVGRKVDLMAVELVVLLVA